MKRLHAPPHEYVIVHSLSCYTAVDCYDGTTLCTMENEQSLIALMDELGWTHKRLYAEELK